MEAAAVEIRGLKVKRAQLGETFGAQAGELIQQITQGRRLAGANAGPAIEGGKGHGLAGVENHSSTGNPVFLFGLNEMGDYIEGAHGVIALVGAGPGIWKSAQQGIQGGRGAGEQGYGAFEILLH